MSQQIITSAVEQTARELADANRRAADLLVMLDTLFSGCAVGFACWDEHLRCLRMNGCLAQIAGARAEDCQGRPLSAVMPSLSQQVEPLCQRVLQTREPLLNVEVTNEPSVPAGEARHWLVSVYPTLVTEMDKRIAAVGMALTEITAQKRTEQNLICVQEEAAVASRDAALTAAHRAEQASANKNQTLAWVSHELRRPLTPVLMELSALLADPTADAALRSSLEMMVRNLTLQAKLIEDLVDATRLNQSRITLRLEPVNMHDLVRQAVEVSTPEIKAKELTLSLDLSARFPYVSGDPRRLLQVLWNLTHNATKFTPRGGSIWIRASNAEHGANPEPDLLIEVQDTGMGIDPADLEKVFQPFEQAGMGSNKRSSGLGLGLTLSRSLAVLHGGTLTAGSHGKDRGSTLSLTLPTIPAPS